MSRFSLFLSEEVSVLNKKIKVFLIPGHQRINLSMRNIFGIVFVLLHIFYILITKLLIIVTETIAVRLSRAHLAVTSKCM